MELSGATEGVLPMPKTTKSTTKAATDKVNASKANVSRSTSDAPAKAAAKALVDAVQTEDTHTELATPSDEAKMRKAATSPSAVKAALEAGKKDPIEKWGDPDAKPDMVRRAAMGG